MVGSMLEFIGNHLIPSVRRVVKNGREFLVAPISLIVPGVLNGSKGALYYPSSECKKNTSWWDDMPITAAHPADPITNEAIPANTPGVWERQGLGILKNTFMNGKLRTEGWFDARRTYATNRTIYQALVTGQPLEISTGLYTDNQPMRGVHNGRAYEFIARNYQPDHLAILTNEVGACSLADGCGLNVNANPEGINQYTHGGGGGRQRLPAKMRKWSISRADQELRKTGHSLTGKGHFDMGTMTARYEVQHPDGSKKMMSIHDIARLTGNAAGQPKQPKQPKAGGKGAGGGKGGGMIAPMPPAEETGSATATAKMQQQTQAANIGGPGGGGGGGGGGFNPAQPRGSGGQFGGGQINPQQLQQAIQASLQEGGGSDKDPGKPSWKKDDDKDVDDKDGKGDKKSTKNTACCSAEDPCPD